MTAAELLDRLDKVKRSGDGWAARCPAHEDRNPSLSVAEGDDGRVLVRCQAGCTSEAIVAALGLELRDLFAEERPGANGSRRVVATYPYMDETGALLFEAVRFEPKGFAQRRPDGSGGWEWSLRGVRRVLYRTPELRAALERGETTVYVVEGEKDVHAIEKAGGVATTCPMGAGKWRPEYAEQLRGFEVAVVVADRDEAGLAHARQVAAAIAGSVYSVELVQAAEGKDAHDHLAAGHRLDGFVPLDDDAIEFDPELPVVDEPALPVLTARETCELPDPDDEDELLGQLVARRYRVVVAGGTGQGKTTFGLGMVAAIVTGGHFLDWQGAGECRALVVDLEQGLRTVKRRLREARLHESDVVDYVRVPDGLALNDLTTGDALALRRVLERGYDVVLLDPHYKAHRMIDSNVERATVDLMRLLDYWRDELGFALILPAHNRKLIPGAKLTIDDVFGSSALVRGAEVVLGLQLVSDGYSRLHFFKDRDGDLPVGGDPWGLLFDREHGYRRDPNDEAPARDYEAEIGRYLTEHPRSTTNAIAKGISAGKTTVSNVLKKSDRFSFEPGANNSRLWVDSGSQNHSVHLPGLEADSGGPAGALPRRGSTAESTVGSGGLDPSDHPPQEAAP